VADASGIPRALSRPAPPWTFWLAVACVGGCFLLAAAAFRLPLSYCDSPSWAPDYLAQLLDIDAQVNVRDRGVFVPAWFRFWGAVSIASGLGNLIGWVQAALVGGSALAVLLYLKPGLTWIELVLLPALVLSGLRHAVYSQTVMSEPVVIPLVVGLTLWLMRTGPVSLRACAVIPALAVVATSSRPENLVLVALVLARVAADAGPLRQRAQRLALALAVASGVSVGFARLAPDEPGEPIGRVMVVAEWMRFLEPPRNALARLLHSDLAERLSPDAAAGVRTIYDGLPPTQRLFEGPHAPSWPATARFVLYQLANRPFTVLVDRMRVGVDLHASGYAAFWPGYSPASSFYQAYDQVFVRWTPEDFDAARYSCPIFARAQLRHYGPPVVRSERAVAALHALHAAGVGYAQWVLRPLYWLAVPVSLLLIAGRRAGAPYVWLVLLLVGNLGLKAASVYADERYQLPVDLLALAWLMLTLRHAFASGSARARPEVRAR